MTTPKGDRARAGSQSTRSAISPVPPLAPLKPRPRLFRWLGAGVILWLLILLFLYFETVFPHRAESQNRDAGPALAQSEIGRAQQSIASDTRLMH